MSKRDPYLQGEIWYCQLCGRENAGQPHQIKHPLAGTTIKVCSDCYNLSKGNHE